MTSQELAQDRTAPSNVRVVTLEQAIADARRRLDDFERRYGVPSARLDEVFTDATGTLRKTGDYFQWTCMLQRWHELRSRAG